MSKSKFTIDTSNDDDNFFVNLECASTNLENVFGIEKRHEPGGITTLKQKPLKEQSASTTTYQQPWNIIFAKAAVAYKINDAMGKVGVALLQNALNACKLIVYKTKTTQLATLTLTPLSKTVQIHKQSGYIQFYDDERFYWSLFFENEMDEQELIVKLTQLNITVQLDTNSIASSADGANENSNDCVENINVPVLPDGVDSDISPLTKTDLISRMAKMGQKLPNLPMTARHQTTTEYSDSSDTEIITQNTKPAIVPRSKIHPKSQIVSTASVSALYKPTATIINPIESQYVQLLVTENRTQNTEMRINMSKMDNKIEKVLDKIDLLQTEALRGSHKEEELLQMEEKILELKKENHKLRMALADKGYQSPTVSTNLEDGVESESESMVKVCQHNLSISEMNLAECNNQLKTKENQLQEKVEQYAQVMIKLQEYEAIITKKEHQCDVLQNKLAEQEKLHTKEIVRQDTQTIMSTVKTVMNSLYSHLDSEIGNIKVLTKENVMNVLGKTIREQTLDAIQNLQQ